LTYTSEGANSFAKVRFKRLKLHGQLYKQKNYYKKMTRGNQFCDDLF